MTYRVLFVLSGIVLLAAACAAEEPTVSERNAAFATLAPSSLAPPPRDVTNAFADDPRAARFGQRLFFDSSFSGELLDPDNDGSAESVGKVGETGKVSCASCHVPSRGFSDTRSIRTQLSLGTGWGIRRSPSLLDVGQSKLLMWDGRHDTMFNQVFGPIESPVEMNGGRLHAAQRVFANHRAEYESIFGPLPPLDDAKRFPPLTGSTAGCRTLGPAAPVAPCKTPMRGAPGDGAEFDGLAAADKDAVTRVVVNVGKAIGAYERLLACGPSRFDSWVHGDAGALSEEEQRGATLFAGKAKCIDCHSGPYFSDEKFHNVGLTPSVVSTVFLDANDVGAAAGLPQMASDPLSARGLYSDGYDDRHPSIDAPQNTGAFRTPKLRCASRRPSFMHTAQLRTLADVVGFFNRGGSRNGGGYPGTSEIAPLGLTPDEQRDLTHFLEALDGPGPPASLLEPLPPFQTP